MNSAEYINVTLINLIGKANLYKHFALQNFRKTRLNHLYKLNQSLKGDLEMFKLNRRDHILLWVDIFRGK